MPNFFDINNLFFEAFGYKMSHLEFWATLTGAAAVWLSVQESIWSWVIGCVSVSLAFVLFFQIQLYPDMFLQIFFFITNIIGFWQWKFPKAGNSNLHNELKISKLSQKELLIFTIIGIIATALLGTFARNLNEWFPQFFSKPSAFPYMDSFTTVMSIYATFLLIYKKVESWWVWLFVDAISTYMYFVKDVKIYALFYFIYCFVALVGAIRWTREYRNYEDSK